MMPHEPIAVPHCINEAESSGMSSVLRSVVVPFLNKHYDSVKREHQI